MYLVDGVTMEKKKRLLLQKVSVPKHLLDMDSGLSGLFLTLYVYKEAKILIIKIHF